MEQLATTGTCKPGWPWLALVGLVGRPPAGWLSPNLPLQTHQWPLAGRKVAGRFRWSALTHFARSPVTKLPPASPHLQAPAHPGVWRVSSPLRMIGSLPTLTCPFTRDALTSLFTSRHRFPLLQHHSVLEQTFSALATTPIHIAISLSQSIFRQAHPPWRPHRSQTPTWMVTSA